MNGHLKLRHVGLGLQLAIISLLSRLLCIDRVANIKSMELFQL